MSPQAKSSKGKSNMQVVSRKTNAEFSGELRPNRCRIRMIVGESTFYSPVRMFVKFLCVSRGKHFHRPGCARSRPFAVWTGNERLPTFSSNCVIVEAPSDLTFSRENVFSSTLLRASVNHHVLR